MLATSTHHHQYFIRQRSTRCYSATRAATVPPLNTHTHGTRRRVLLGTDERVVGGRFGYKTTESIRNNPRPITMLRIIQHVTKIDQRRNGPPHHHTTTEASTSTPRPLMIALRKQNNFVCDLFLSCSNAKGMLIYL